MKRVLIFLVLVLALVGCMANPAVMAGGQSENLTESVGPSIDAEGLLEVVQPYLDAWGPCDTVETHICGNCEGVVCLSWFDAQDQMTYYVMLERVDGEWIVIRASEIVGVEPASTT